MMFVIVKDLRNMRTPPMLFVAPDNVSEDGINTHLEKLKVDPACFMVSVLCADTPTVLGSDKEIAEFVGGID